MSPSGSFRFRCVCSIHNVAEQILSIDGSLYIRLICTSKVHEISDLESDKSASRFIQVSDFDLNRLSHSSSSLRVCRVHVRMYGFRAGVRM